MCPDTPYFIILIMGGGGGHLSFIYPERGGFGKISIIVEGKISPNPPGGGYINALLYRKNTWI